jgi:hypothetical protein
MSTNLPCIRDDPRWLCLERIDGDVEARLNNFATCSFEACESVQTKRVYDSELFVSGFRFPAGPSDGLEYKER